MLAGEREVDEWLALFQGSRMNLHTAVEWNELPLLVKGRSSQFCIC